MPPATSRAPRAPPRRRAAAGRETIRATLSTLVSQEHLSVAVILSDDPSAVLNLLHPTDERPGDARDLRQLELLSMEHVQARTPPPPSPPPPLPQNRRPLAAAAVLSCVAAWG